MALAKRIIPCLDVDNGRVVKGVNFVDIRDAGDPVEIARRYDQQGADVFAGAAHGVGHEGRTAFVGYQHGLDRGGPVQLIVNLGVVHTGDAERVTDANLFQGVPDQPCAGFSHC